MSISCSLEVSYQNLNSVSSYPHLMCSPPFLSVSSKTYSEISATHLRSTVAGHKTALPATVKSTRTQSNFSKRVVSTRLSIWKLLIKCKFTQLCPSADILNLHAWRMCSVALLTNTVTLTSVLRADYAYRCRQIDSLRCAQLHGDKYFTLARAAYT